MKKQLVGITGLLLCGFLVSHLVGNILIATDPDAFNVYAYTLTSNPLIYVAEAILAAIFLGHLGLAMKITIENKMARPESYYQKTHTGRGTTFASSTMPITGLIILVFLVLHILHFKFGEVYMTQIDGIEMRDLYKTVVIYFQDPLHVTWYVFAMTVLGLHLSHGFQSAFQTLGLNHPKYNSLIKNTGRFYFVVVSAGFAFLAIWCHFKGEL